MPEFAVTVSRTCYSCKEIRVEAKDKKEAIEKAEALAPNEEFSDELADYKAMSATNLDEVGAVGRAMREGKI